MTDTPGGGAFANASPTAAPAPAPTAGAQGLRQIGGLIESAGSGG